MLSVVPIGAWLRLTEASMAWVIEAAPLCLVIFGCATAGWVIGFAMGYRRGARDAIVRDIACAGYRMHRR